MDRAFTMHTPGESCCNLLTTPQQQVSPTNVEHYMRSRARAHINEEPKDDNYEYFEVDKHTTVAHVNKLKPEQASFLKTSTTGRALGQEH